MRKIINRRIYDEDRSQMIASGSVMPDRYIEKLYRTGKGNYFKVEQDMSDDKANKTLKILSPQEAIIWLERYRNSDDYVRSKPLINVDKVYQEYFSDHLKEA